MFTEGKKFPFKRLGLHNNGTSDSSTIILKTRKNFMFSQIKKQI